MAVCPATNFAVLGSHRNYQRQHLPVVRIGHCECVHSQQLCALSFCYSRIPQRGCEHQDLGVANAGGQRWIARLDECLCGIKARLVVRYPLVKLENRETLRASISPDRLLKVDEVRGVVKDPIETGDKPRQKRVTRPCALCLLYFPLVVRPPLNPN